MNKNIDDDEDNDTDDAEDSNDVEPVGNTENWIATGMYVATDADNNDTLYAVMLNKQITSTGKYLSDRKIVHDYLMQTHQRRKWVAFDFHKSSDSVVFGRMWVRDGFNIKHSVGKMQ